MAQLSFPKGFRWGSATAAYQIEGAAREDGRGESIWDRYCQMPGNIVKGDEGSVACDHYHRYREDVALMKELGHNSYRFSVSWPRIFPSGRGSMNQKGLDFYSRLVDELRAAGIEPFVTLYHWDLPQELQDLGGWTNREVAQLFADYASVVYRRLGDRVDKWITLNEPFNSSFISYFVGRQAPGYRDMSSAIAASYNLLLGHGLAVDALRASGKNGEIGITLNLMPRHPVSDSEADKLAVQYDDGYANRWFLDPIFRGSFPADMIDLYETRGLTLPKIAPGDLKQMSRPIDFIGLNYYFVVYVQANPKSWPFGAEVVVPKEVPTTDRNWAIVPEGLTEMLLRLKNEYGCAQIYITENGAAYNDVMSMDGTVEDYGRVDYIRRHLVAAHSAISQGVNLKGYFVWSMYDNFEWSFGRYSRFGIVYNDFSTQKRTVKRSGSWLKEVIERNSFES